ncbi:MAG TPA: PA14 domain-containing protein [Planctomycetota bacterium]|nr:PA14 domain-containing protein [Planctomycetota bacterium]
MRPLRTLLVPLLAALPFAGAVAAEGLIGEYFDETTEYPEKLTGKKPVLVRVDKQVNFGDVTGQFYKTKLAERFSARWSGSLTIATAGTYEFSTESDDGSQLTIDGKVVVDNGGEHGMQKKSGSIELTAGSHAVVMQFQQGGGGAGCKLFWKTPGGKEEIVPSKALSHDDAALKAIAWDKVAWDKRKGGGGSGKFATMDHGPYYTGSVVVPAGTAANKGMIITLNQERSAYACFDAELLSLCFAGVDTEVSHPAGRDGLEGQMGLTGEAIALTKSAGWAKPGSSDCKDPRAKGLGNLPKDWGHYKGLYLNGQTTILSYSVGTADVLEVDALEGSGKNEAITRSFTLSNNTDPATVLVSEGTATVEGGIAVIENGDAVIAVGALGGTLAANDGKVLLTIPGKTTLAKVVLWRGPKAEVGAFKAVLAASPKPVDAKPLTKGGKPRWTEPVVTQGELGKAKDGDAYVCDTLTVPYENPWKCYMRTTALDFFKDGRIAVSTIDGDVWVVTPSDDKLTKLTWKRYATGMFQCLGLKIVDDVVYVTCRDRLVRLHDLNNDGEADFYENFNGDCEVTRMYHEFALCLETDQDGNFYYNKGSNLGDSSSEHQSRVLKVSKDGSTLTGYATGMRAPNGMGGGDGFPLTNSDNQGNWTPACRINLVKEGGFYGFMGGAHRDPKPTTYDPPICWVPMSTDNSSGGQVWVSSDKWGPLKGNLLHMSYGQSSLFVMPFEEIGGVPQGGIVKIPVNLQSSGMRARFSKLDG